MRGEPWDSVRAARLPAAAIPALAALRHRTDIRLIPQGDTVWVRWPEANAAAIEALFTVPDVAFFIPKDGFWRQVHHRLPATVSPPEGDGRPLATFVMPASFEPHAPSEPAAPPIPIRLVPGGVPRPATALACELEDLALWADTATTQELSAVRAARCGDRVVLLGKRLPTVANAIRHWGDLLLVPLGFRIDPELPQNVVRDAVGAAENELVLFDERGAECIPRESFQPVTRASLRLAAGRGGAA
ncbi:MAG: hypothetical protein U0791_20810 [Gemmataceae bacterium]